MGQLSTYIVQRALGDNVALNIAFEQELFESLISASSTPESSFLNLLTALAVMPMAAFTTLAVLGGGAGEPPSWMRPESGSSASDTQEQLDTLSAGLDHLAAEVAEASSAPSAPSVPVYAPAVVQHVMVPVAQPEAVPPPMQQATGSMVDDLDFDRLAERVGPASTTTAPRQPSHDEPVIRGFDLQTGEER